MTRTLIILALIVPLLVQGQITFKEKGSYDKEGNCKGTWKYFLEDGTLIKSIDYDTGEKRYYSTYRDPYDDLFEKMKLMADSFLLESFDEWFISNHIKWEPNESYYYGPGIAGRWFEPASVKPDKFLYRYRVIFDPKRSYPELIRFQLDEHGNVVHEIDEDLTGLVNCKGSSVPCRFNSTYKQALDTASARGLNTNGKTSFYLDWRRIEPEGTIYGEYELVVAHLRTTEKRGSKTTYYYDAVIIDPWTGEFKERVELKSYTILHRHSAFSSGIQR